jgi:hypothetical protein
MSRFILEFPSCGVYTPTLPVAYVPADLRSDIIYIWTVYPKINCTYSCIFLSYSRLRLIMNVNTFSLNYFHLED